MSVFRIRIRIGSGFNQVSESGSGYRRAKMTHKNRKKVRNFMLWSAGCSLLRVEGFSCSLDVLYGGLRIRLGKIAIFDQKISKQFFRCNFFKFLIKLKNTGSGSPSVFSLKCWLRIRTQWIRIRNTGPSLIQQSSLQCFYKPKHYFKKSFSLLYTLRPFCSEVELGDFLKT